MNQGWADGLVQLRDIREQDRPAFEAALIERGVTHIVSAGFHPSRDQVPGGSGFKQVEVYEASGLHPMAEGAWDFDEWSESVQRSNTRLIGEVGYDKRSLATVPWREQYRRAEAALEIAVQQNASVIWHSVHATERSLAFIETAHRRGVRGVWHGFQGSIETARRVCLHGWMIGLSPTLMSEKSLKLAKVAVELELQSIVIESDWPQQFGGYCLDELGAFLAKRRKISSEELQNQLFMNFFRFVAGL